MANVEKKDAGNGGKQQQQQNPTESQRADLVRRDPYQQMSRDPWSLFNRDPFQIMRELMVDPFRMMQPSQWGLFGRGDVGLNPAFEVRETDDAFVIKADIPGIKNDDIDIQLSGNLLQITGKREQQQEQDQGRFHTYERSYGSFTRSFTLPESADVDKIRSDLKDGELSLVVPKKPGSTPQRRKIQIGSGSRS